MKRFKKQFDYHEGLSPNQVQIILAEFNLDVEEFNKWLYGQTCPIISRQDKKGITRQVCGIYEYDLFRWINSRRKKRPLIWD